MAKPLQRVPYFHLFLKEAQFRGIGHMVIQWAFLESEIDREIAWLLSRSEHRRRHVNFRARFSIRANRWIELARRSYKKHPKRVKAVERIIGHAHNIKPERDDLVHGGLSGSGSFFKIQAGHVIEISHTVGQAPNIEDLACRISDISVELLKHHVELQKHFRRSP